ncbi:MAG: hypothetical protein KBH11_08480 [Bacteroidia bacterium]|nr:hypothetical protein [Bacteroidota bacterium]MBP9083099.1 hypothetical protein [Bacteroidia bacterium]MBK7971056.1 hypothetical protein [Bacteroidota bacterium]MBK8415917.1 hypothetical protein [Bacteroidota bacterium]MBK8872442.1 hypothetical protein [Bacteroidota bacterium]
MATGGLEKLQITGYTDNEYQSQLSGDPYSCMLNPESLKWNKRIEYNKQQPPDSSSTAQKYKRTPSDTLDFDIIIDCTGIVDPQRVNLSDEIEELEKIVFAYNGKIHRPNFVKIQWGKKLIFKGVLVTMNISYTLFRPNGSPLRAKISLSFEQYLSPSTLRKIDKPESPDVTHLVKVIEGQTLPMICYRTWNDPFKYIEVAEFNKLNKFRQLKGHSNLILPPVNL